MSEITIRRATRADAPALAALERASPERGIVTVGVEPKVDHFTLAARHPGTRAYVALAPNGSDVVGMLFASIAPTQLNGELASGAYCFALRVHPGYRRRGIATALLEHAAEEARAESDARTMWGAVFAGNEPSLGAVRRAGFVQSRRLHARVVFPQLLRARRTAGVRYRAAADDDLTSVAAALNARYANHQFWRPLTADHLKAERMALHPAARNLTLALAPDESVLGAASGVAVHQLTRLRLLGFPAAPLAVNAVLRPFLGLIPLRAVLLRRLLLPSGEEALASELLRRLTGNSPGGYWSPLVIPIDHLDPGYAFVARLPGFTVHFCLVVRSHLRIDDARPWYFD